MSAPEQPTDTWRPADIPDQAGRTVVVTGPTVGGLGHHVALELARRGARVVLAGRTPEKLDATATAITEEVPSAALEHLVVDLADLASVRRGATAAARFGAIDVLINNAGVMATPRRRTGDGFDLQLATNHFGPFLLTGLLMPQLTASEAGTVVAVSSVAHRLAKRAPLDDPTDPGGRLYRTWQVYGRSKLANLLSTFELDRRCRETGIPVKAVAAHPGASGSHLVANGRFGQAIGGLAGLVDRAAKLVTQPVAVGAWPLLMAATADLPGGTYCGPSGFRELGGPPQVVGSTSLARDPDAARALWELSERTTGVHYP